MVRDSPEPTATAFALPLVLEPKRILLDTLEKSEMVRLRLLLGASVVKVRVVVAMAAVLLERDE